MLERENKRAAAPSSTAEFVLFFAAMLSTRSREGSPVAIAAGLEHRASFSIRRHNNVSGPVV